MSRSDWQLEIKSLDFQEASLIDSALRSFSHSISFRRTENMNDISAAPQRKVIFPATAPVSRFVEKAAIRYRLMGTKYTFEIARYDEYSRGLVPAFPGQNPPTLVGPILEMPSTSWGASVFDPNWDNLLGEHANLPVGHSARYNPNLDTFFPPYFPPREQSGTAEKHVGFWNFVSLVQQAAELLSPPRPHPPPTPEEGISKTSPSPKKPASPGGKKGKTTSNNSSPTIDAKGLTGMIDADLGTLF